MQIGHHLPHRRRDLQRIAIGLPDDAQPDPRLAIGAQDRGAGRRTQFYPRHIAQHHPGGHGQRGDLLGAVEGRRGADLQALPVRTQGASGGVKSRRPQRATQIGQRQPARGQLQHVHIHAEDQAAVAENLQIGNAGRR